jgi:outer membrane lipopolysaccharide assembly protein LptE/RlpB
MPDALTLILLGLQIAGFGACFWQLRRLQQSVDALESGAGIVRGQVDSLLKRTDRRAVADEAALVEEWRTAAEAAPEGSPKREAYMNRLRELGAI